MIYLKLVKETQPAIIGPLTNIFQKSVNEGKISDDWKSANVTTIFKNGDGSKPNNYRPIA